MGRAGTLGLAMLLALAAWPARAVDVDRIEIRSRRGEPLVAEIPITGASAEDLRALQAGLASPTTFARIGLPRPQGVVAGLRFEVVRGARPVIRVTSSQPVNDDFLTFLMQVEAPQGRLVREYSIALGSEPTLPDAVPPQIQAPVQAGPDLVQRAPASDPAYALPPPVAEPEAQVPPLPVAPPPAQAIPLQGDRTLPAAPAAAPAPVASKPRRAPAAAPSRIAAAPAPTPAPAPARRAAPAPARPAATPAAAPPRPAPPRAPQPGDYVVRPGDTLTAAVDRMEVGGTPAQAMLAVLRTNPDAFAGGNINQLRRGAVLRPPAATEVTRLSPGEAEAAVRLQIEQWRTGTIPPPQQPVAALPVDAATPVPAAPAAPPPIPVVPRAGAPRLEIAPAGPGEGATQAGGGAAGGTQADRDRAAAEALAVRYTEFQQMQQRVADLEQQQKALLLQNAQLASQPSRGSGALAWIVAALAVLIAIAAVLWARRAPARRSKATSKLAERLSGPA